MEGGARFSISGQLMVRGTPRGTEESTGVWEGGGGGVKMAVQRGRCACVRASVRARKCACARACVRACELVYVCERGYVRARVSQCVCVRACVRACGRVCGCVCVCECVCVPAPLNRLTCSRRRPAKPQATEPAPAARAGGPPGPHSRRPERAVCERKQPAGRPGIAHASGGRPAGSVRLGLARSCGHSSNGKQPRLRQRSAARAPYSPPGRRQAAPVRPPRGRMKGPEAILDPMRPCWEVNRTLNLSRSRFPCSALFKG